MRRIRSEAETTITPILRDDGTVYFQYDDKTLGERFCQWTLGLLWFLVAAVTVAALV